MEHFFLFLFVSPVEIDVVKARFFVLSFVIRIVTLVLIYFCKFLSFPTTFAYEYLRYKQNPKHCMFFFSFVVVDVFRLISFDWIAHTPNTMQTNCSSYFTFVNSYHFRLKCWFHVNNFGFCQNTLVHWLCYKSIWFVEYYIFRLNLALLIVWIFFFVWNNANFTQKLISNFCSLYTCLFFLYSNDPKKQNQFHPNCVSSKLSQPLYKNHNDI